MPFTVSCVGATADPFFCALGRTEMAQGWRWTLYVDSNTTRHSQARARARGQRLLTSRVAYVSSSTHPLRSLNPPTG